jgi:hypothetical protein
VFGKVHQYVGPVILLGGIINGFTCFNFSREPHNNAYYGAAVAVVLVIVLALLGWKRWSVKQAHGDSMSSDERLHPESYPMDGASKNT